MTDDAEGLRRAHADIGNNNGKYIQGNTLYTRGSTPTPAAPPAAPMTARTGSVGKAFAELGWAVFSVDSDPKASPSLLMNINKLTPAHVPGTPYCLWQALTLSCEECSPSVDFIKEYEVVRDTPMVTLDY